jgi:UDP-2-acetamido-2-deoxy-ribo-hexuluronate aminotransferase
VQDLLKAAGVPTAVHYPKPLHRQPAYARYGERAHAPVSDDVAARVMSLPMSADLSDAQMDRVVDALAHATAG